MPQLFEHPETGEPITQLFVDLISDTKFCDLLMTWLANEGDAESSDDLYTYCERIFPPALTQAYVDQITIRKQKGG